MTDDEQARTGEVTQLLHNVRDGKEGAFDELFSLVYAELRKVARGALHKQRREHTLQTTALVNEAYLKLAPHADASWQNRAHFFSIAARAMKQILIDHARKRTAQKRGGDRDRTTLTSKHLAFEVALEELLALDEALDRLDERQRQVVEYRFFGGMTEEEIAEVLDVSTRTVQRDWAKARAWLYRDLYPTDNG